MIGGIAETQEMLDYCASKKIVSDVEMIPIQKINEAYERMLKSDVRYRFVIDIASLKGELSAQPAPSSTSRTFRARASGENGFWRNATPDSTMPWRTTASSV